MDPEDLRENDVDLEGEEDGHETTSSDEEKIDDEDSDDSSDTNTSEDDDAEMNGFGKDKLSEQEYKIKLQELEQSIKENKLQYQSYIDIIKLTRDNSDMNKLREYRIKMSELYPLTENLWLEWLKDEEKLMSSETDRPKITDLFEKAVKDYLSVGIWLEYIQFSIGGMGEKDGVENVRSICERATSFAGLHVTHGHLLWEAYREFENALLSGYQVKASFSGQEQTNELNEQMNKITRIFKLELNTCLMETENTLNELKEFDNSLFTGEIKKAYEKTKEKLKQIEKFESALKTANDDPVKKLNEYKTYLDFEYKLITDLEKNKIKQNNKSNNDKLADESIKDLAFHRQRLKCLFERAIADDFNCLDVSLWLKYILYLNEEEGFIETNEAQREFNLSVAKRSIRNISWSSRLWTNYAILLERTNASPDTLKSLFNEAMNIGLQTGDDYLQIWHAYLDYLKRNFLKNETNIEFIEELREKFKRAINQLFDYFKHQGDPTFSLEKYWANLEAKYFKNMDQCRKIYNEMILAKSDLCKYSPIWIEFYDLEREFGDEKHQRKILNRALNEVTNPEEKEIIYDLLLKFEKLNGNIQQFSNVYYKFERFKLEQLTVKQIIKKKPESKKDVQKQPKPVNNFQQNEKQNKFASTKSSVQTEQTTKTLKRKKSDPDLNELPQSEAKKQLVNLKDKDGFAIPNMPILSAVTTAPKPVVEISPTPSSTSSENYKKYSNLTVFISNLSFDVDETKLKAIFEKEPGFKEIRLLKHWSGKCKGYGYVDFETVEQATNALKLDRTPVDGRPVFVSKNEDKSLDFGLNKLKYAVNLEKNKLFVSGLPFTTENKDLEEIFKTFGKLKEVRIVTYKNGNSKGLAYVEYEDEQSASKALVQTDRMLVGDRQISVAISNPPKRKQTSMESEKTQIRSSLGSGTYSGASTPSSTSSSSFSFVPRSQIVGRKTKIDFKK